MLLRTSMTANHKMARVMIMVMTHWGFQMPLPSSCLSPACSLCHRLRTTGLESADGYQSHHSNRRHLMRLKLQNHRLCCQTVAAHPTREKTNLTTNVVVTVLPASTMCIPEAILTAIWFMAMRTAISLMQQNQLAVTPTRARISTTIMSISKAKGQAQDLCVSWPDQIWTFQSLLRSRRPSAVGRLQGCARRGKIECRPVIRRAGSLPVFRPG